MVKLLLSALRWAGVFGLNLGGGGGGKTPANTTQTVISDVAPWAREAAKETLAKGMELTEQGYEQYGGNRLAGFDPMQQQSYDSAQGMTVAPQIGQATNYATEAGNYSPVGQQYTGANVSQYMNPYLQGALAPQIREAATAGMMAQQQNAAKAVGMGAFGGSRGALQQSLTEKNTLQNMADINARGYSDAFNQAAGMFNTDQARRIQEAQFGTNAKLSSAAQLGQLGQQQYTQNMGINELQNKYGQQRQAQAQKGLDIGYQDWMNQKNFDWDQIMRRSDLLRAVPSGSSSTTSMYKTGPSTAQNVAAIGTTAAGASQLFARGGLAYADGGITGDENVAAIVPTLSKAQLEQALAIAKQSGDPERIRVIAEELQKREATDSMVGEQPIPANSISAMANPEMVDNIMPTQASMANGGIVAFEEGGQVGAYYPGNQSKYDEVAQLGIDALRKKQELRAPAALTPEQYRAAIKADYDELQSLGGDDPYGPMQERLKGREAKLVEQEKKDKGLALLAAVPELLQGSNFAEAAGRGIGAAAKSYQGSLAENAKQRNAIEEYQFLMDDAKRKERMGDLKGARESVRDAQKLKNEAFKTEQAMLQGDSTAAAALAASLRPQRPTGGGAGSQPKFDMSFVRAMADQIRAENPDMPDTEVQARAYKAVAARMRDRGMSGVVATTTQAALKIVEDSLMSRRNKEAMQALADKDFGGDIAKAKAHAVEQITAGTPLEDILEEYSQTIGGNGGGGGAKPKVIKLK